MRNVPEGQSIGYGRKLHDPPSRIAVIPWGMPTEQPSFEQPHRQRIRQGETGSDYR
ncbi:MAG: hypothetical protein ACLTZT_00760 [Butyricimonas faecalis]